MGIPLGLQPPPARSLARLAHHAPCSLMYTPRSTPTRLRAGQPRHRSQAHHRQGDDQPCRCSYPCSTPAVASREPASRQTRARGLRYPYRSPCWLWWRQCWPGVARPPHPFRPIRPRRPRLPPLQPLPRQHQSPAPATSTSAATPNTSGSPSFVVNATTQDGDKVKIEGWFGSPLPAGESDIDQTAFSECPPPATDGRAIVVHLDLATTLETSLSGEVELNTGSAVAGTDYVMGYGSGAQCESEAEGTGAKLGTLQPHQSTDFTMWLVSVNAITPNDQHPSEKVLGARDWVMELPQVTVDGSSSLDGHLSATGPRVVTCETGGPLPSRSEYVAPIGSTSKRLHLAVCPATS